MHDAEVVNAVKNGDRDAYRQLVERYQRMVFGIAWSRLGDHGLSEEAAQEAFVKAFKYLAVLRNPDKFAGWLARIARNVSVSMLRKNRRELNSRQCWQMMQTPLEPADASAGEAAPVAETLRQTLAAMPEKQRECLVLFYLEGKNIREAAAALGISEASMKTRLHRARQALRDLLEENLDRSLGSLKPRKNLSVAVMTALPSMPYGVAGGGSVLASLFGMLAKPVLGVMFMVWLPLMAVTGMMILGITEFHAENMAPGAGQSLRQKVLRRNAMMSWLVGSLCILLSLPVLFAGGRSWFFCALAVVMFVGFLQSLRQLRVNRSLFMVGQTLNAGLFAASFVAFGLFEWSFPLYYAFMLVILINQFFTFGNAPLRGDYNLFLRQANGLLGLPDNSPAPPVLVSKAELRKFVRFLGLRNLAVNYAPKRKGVVVLLPPVRLRIAMSLGFWGALSKIHLGLDGKCEAFLCNPDLRDIRQMNNGASVNVEALETSVAAVVERALRAFQAGNMAEAERLVQPESTEAVFVNPRFNAKLMRGMSLFGIVLLLISLVSFPFVKDEPRTRITVWKESGISPKSRILGEIKGCPSSPGAVVCLFPSNITPSNIKKLPPLEFEMMKLAAVKSAKVFNDSFSLENVPPGDYSLMLFPSASGMEEFNQLEENTAIIQVKEGTTMKIELYPKKSTPATRKTAP